MKTFPQVESYRPRETIFDIEDRPGEEPPFMRCNIRTQFGVVYFFTTTGDERTKPFTRCEIHLIPAGDYMPHLYSARFPRHYHKRWLNRLATQFAMRAFHLSKEAGK